MGISSFVSVCMQLMCEHWMNNERDFSRYCYCSFRNHFLSSKWNLDLFLQFTHFQRPPYVPVLGMTQTDLRVILLCYLVRGTDLRPNWASDDKGIFMGAFGVSLFILLTTLAVTFSQFLMVLHYVNVRLKMTFALLLPASLLAYRGGQRRRNLETG